MIQLILKISKDDILLYIVNLLSDTRNHNCNKILLILFFINIYYIYLCIYKKKKPVVSPPSTSEHLICFFNSVGSNLEAVTVLFQQLEYVFLLNYSFRSCKCSLNVGVFLDASCNTCLPN